MKEIQNWKLAERHTMLMDWERLHRQSEYSNYSHDLQSQCNIYQHTNGEPVMVVYTIVLALGS